MKRLAAIVALFMVLSLALSPVSEAATSSGGRTSTSTSTSSGARSSSSISSGSTSKTPTTSSGSGTFSTKSSTSTSSTSTSSSTKSSTGTTSSTSTSTKSGTSTMSSTTSKVGTFQATGASTGVVTSSSGRQYTVSSTNPTTGRSYYGGAYRYDSAPAGVHVYNYGGFNSFGMGMWYGAMLHPWGGYYAMPGGAVMYQPMHWYTWLIDLVVLFLILGLIGWAIRRATR